MPSNLEPNGRGHGVLPIAVHIRRVQVNKQELVASIAEKASMTEALQNNESVTLVGFGAFYVGERAARTGRNPRTGKNIKIKAAKVPKFRAGKGLKDSVN